MNGFDKFLEGIGKALNTVPQVYDDGIKPSVVEAGKLAALPLRCINAALSGVRCWIAQQEYRVDEIGQLLANKLKYVKEDGIVSPEPYVFIPVFQAMTYCMDNEELKNMFANLLAKSMIKEDKDFVHPSFVEIIKQMSPLDAQNLRLFRMSSYGFNIIPVCDYNVLYVDKTTGKEEGTFKTLYKNISLANSNSINEIIQSESISSLIRLGLIVRAGAGHQSASDGVYLPFEETETYKKIQSDIYRSNSKDKIEVVKSYVELTPFGKSFIEICLVD